MKHGYEPSNVSRGVENLLTMPSNPQCLLFGKRWTPFQFTLVVFIFLVLFNEYFIYVFQTMRWPNVPDINRYVLIHVLSFYFFVFIIVTIGPLWPHALDILIWDVDRLCTLHPQAMSVYYQKGITCLTAQLDLTRDSRGLGQVQIIIWAIMCCILCHISSHLLTFGIVTKCLNWHVRVPEKFYWMQNEFGQRTPNISGTVTWLLPGELTLDVDIWGVQIFIGWRNMTMRPFW